MVNRPRPRTWRLPRSFRQPGWRHPQRRPVLNVESLEDRVLPTLFTWTNPAGGDWDNGANWDQAGAVPGAGDSVLINLSGITVTHSTNVADSISSLTFSSPAHDSILDLSDGSLTIAAPSTIDDTLAVHSSGVLTLNVALTVSSSGTINWTGGTLSGSGSLTCQGVLDLEGTIVLDGLTLNNEGSATAGVNGVAGVNWTLAGGAVFNN